MAVGVLDGYSFPEPNTHLTPVQIPGTGEPFNVDSWLEIFESLVSLPPPRVEGDPWLGVGLPPNVPPIHKGI